MIDGFGLLVGHLVGDYRIQNDWMAQNKSNIFRAGPIPDCPLPNATAEEHSEWIEKSLEHSRNSVKAFQGHLACTVHCLLYTLSICVFSCFRFPWWALLICFLAHWVMDRFRLARKVMEMNGQSTFATGPLAPWSIIVVDNCIHLETLWALKMLVEFYGY